MISGRWSLAAAAAVRAASVEAAPSWLSPRCVVAVVSLLSVAAVAVSTVGLLLLISMTAAASDAELAAASAHSVVVFEAALISVTMAVTTVVLESVVGFVPFILTASAGTGAGSGSGSGFGSGSGTSHQLGGF